MAFTVVLSRHLETLAEQLTAAAAEETRVLLAQIAELNAARERSRTRIEELTAANEALTLELEAHAVERETADALRTALAREQEQAARARDAHAAELAQLKAAHAASTQAADTETARLRSSLEASREVLEGEASLLREELAVARRGHRENLVSRLSRLFEEVARGTSVEDVLSAAAHGLADDFPRVAVFVASNGRLDPRYQRGFDADSGIGRAGFVAGDASLLGRTAASGELGVHTGDALTGLPFGGGAAFAVTAPLAVRGELLAVIYADIGDLPLPEDRGAASARVADIIRRHTELRLDRLTAELKVTGDLRGYARMLLDEVEYVYRADVSAKAPDEERLRRLAENLRCARQFFEQRAATEGAPMAHLLDDVLMTTTAARASTPFGRELGSVAAAGAPA